LDYYKVSEKTLARYINEMQTLSSQENYNDITTHSPEYAEPSNIGEGSNNLNVFDRKPRAVKKKKNKMTNFEMEVSKTKNISDIDFIVSLHIFLF
jgi:hypothetical protein